MSKTIIFDFDGTIADSFLIALDVLYGLTHRDRPLPEEDISRLRGMSNREVLQELHIPLWRVPLLLIGARRRLHTRLGEIGLIPGIDDSLRNLHQRYKLFVLSSNSFDNIESFLIRFGIRNYFVGIYSSAHPLWKERKLKKLLQDQCLVPHDVWYVGDEAQDIVAAHKVGLNSVAVAWGYNNVHALESQHPEALVFNPDELTRCFYDN